MNIECLHRADDIREHLQTYVTELMGSFSLEKLATPRFSTPQSYLGEFEHVVGEWQLKRWSLARAAGDFDSILQDMLNWSREVGGVYDAWVESSTSETSVRYRLFACQGPRLSTQYNRSNLELSSNGVQYVVYRNNHWGEPDRERLFWIGEDQRSVDFDGWVSVLQKLGSVRRTTISQLPQFEELATILPDCETSLTLLNKLRLSETADSLSA